jgi:hypothetical protein
MSVDGPSNWTQALDASRAERIALILAALEEAFRI